MRKLRYQRVVLAPAPTCCSLLARPTREPGPVDINLNGKLTGWDLAETFRAAQPKIPVNYVSGNPVEHDRLVPESVFFKKPYDAAAILRSLQEIT